MNPFSKLDGCSCVVAAGLVTTIFLAFFAAVASRLTRMHKSFEIPGSQVVTGAARIQGGAGAVFDLSHLNPGSHVNDGGSVILSCFSPWPSWSKPTRDVAGRGAIGEAILRMVSIGEAILRMV